MDIWTYDPPPKEWAVDSDSEFQPFLLLTQPNFFESR